MRIDHMDVEFSGTNERRSIGPLSSNLNAVVFSQQTGVPRTIRWTPPLSSYQQQILDQVFGAARAPSPIHELQALAFRLGLDNRSGEQAASERQRLVFKERELAAKIERLNSLQSTREQLIGRRCDIEHRLQQLQGHSARVAVSAHYDARLTDRLASIDADLRSAQDEIRQCEHEIAEVKTELKVGEFDRQTVQVDASFREQLQQLEDRLDRWRQTLRDIKAHRESIESGALDARLDEQVGNQLSRSSDVDVRAPLRSLEAQIHHARKQLDHLIAQYPSAQYPSGQSPLVESAGGAPASLNGGYQVRQDPNGRTQITYQTSLAPISPGSLPELLVSMQRDLHEVCHQLSHQQARDAATALQQQVDQLKRCETELLHSVQRLIDQRALLLRKIADRYHLSSTQVSMAFGDWCQCSDHQDLYQWLLQDQRDSEKAPRAQVQSRIALLEKLDRLQAQRKKAALRVEECRRQLRQADLSRSTPLEELAPNQPSVEELELRGELGQITGALSDLDQRDRLVGELDRIRRQIDQHTEGHALADEFQQSVHRHIIGLSGSLYRIHPESSYESRADRGLAYERTDTAEGLQTLNRYEVPKGIVSVAQQLAIAQGLASRGESIPVVISESLDGLDSAALQAASVYLSWISEQQQVIVLTKDRRLVDGLHFHGAQIHVLSTLARRTSAEPDVNQQLAAYANEEEAAKWYRPNVSSPYRSTARQFYLSERDGIEELTAIPSRWLDQLRYLGIDRVGDLIACDPLWLSDSLAGSNLSERAIRNWQSAARLLCSVPGLRPFDARVLVGAGVRTPAHLSSLHPNELLDRVESFLATEKGRSILQSGNPYELTRITSWIAAAKHGLASRHRHGASGQIRRAQRRPMRPDEQSRYFSSNSFRPVPRRKRSPEHWEPASGERSRRGGRTRSTVSAGETAGVGQETGKTVRFYLDLNSPVIDAPSIGSRMSERLQECGVQTVEQLIAANPESLAKRFGHRRVHAETILTWQKQATLVCQIPFLRGHDAQLLVACDITTPEQLSRMRADRVLKQVLEFANTVEGQRLLRGNKQPDLEEVRHWIEWAGQFRQLNAA
jgi:hypothetical protein